MTRYPVLDDCTRDASIIGTAANAKEAAEIWRAWAGSDADDLTPPSMFAYRHPSSLDKSVAAECPDGAFEPIFA